MLKTQFSYHRNRESCFVLNIERIQNVPPFELPLFSSFWLYRLGGYTTISRGNGSEDKKENSEPQADFLGEGTAGEMYRK